MEMFLGPVNVLSNMDSLEFQYIAKLLERGYMIFESFKCEKELATLSIHLLYRLALLFTTPVDGVISRSAKKGIPIVGCPHFDELEETLEKAFKYFERFTDSDFMEHLLIGTRPNVVLSKFLRDVAEQMEKFKAAFKIKQAFYSLLEDKDGSHSLSSSSGTDKLGASGTGSSVREFTCDLRDIACQAAVDSAIMDKLLAKKRFATAREVESFIKSMSATAEFFHAAMEATIKIVSAGPFSIIMQTALREFWQDRMNGECSVALAGLCDAMKIYLVDACKVSQAGGQSIISDVQAGPFRTLPLEAGRVDILDVAKLFNCIPRHINDLHAVLALLNVHHDRVSVGSPWTIRKDPTTHLESYVHRKTKEKRPITQKPPGSDVLVLVLPPRSYITVKISAATSLLPPASQLPLPPLLFPMCSTANTTPSVPLHMFWNAGQEKLLTSAFASPGWVIVTGPRLAGKSTRILSVLHNEQHASKDGSKGLEAGCSRVSAAAARDKVYVDFNGVTCDCEGRSRVAAQLSFKHLQDGADLLASLNDLYVSLRPNSVVVLDNFDSLLGLVLTTSTFASRKPGSFGLSGKEQFLSLKKSPVVKSFASELLDSLRPWQESLCIVLVVHSKLVVDVTGAAASKRQPKITKVKHGKPAAAPIDRDTSTIAPIDVELNSGREQFRVPSFVETFLDVLPQKRKIVILPLNHKPALALARSLQLIDAESLVLAGRYLPGEMAFLYRFCSLKTIRSIAALRTAKKSGSVDFRGAVAGRDGKRPSSASPQPLCPGSSVMRLWDAATNLVLRDLLDSLSPDELLAASSIIPGVPPINDACSWAVCREAFNGDLLRWRVAYRGLIRSGWLVEAGDLGYLTFAPLGYVVPVPESSTLPPTCPPSLPIESNIASASLEQSAMSKPPPPPRTNLSPPAASSSPMALLEHLGALYLHYWAGELVRIDDLCEENILHASSFDKHLPHYRIMLASMVASTLGIDIRSGETLQGWVDDAAGESSQHSPRRMLSFGRSLSLSFALDAGIDNRDESEVEIPLLFAPNTEVLGLRLAGRLGRLLSTRFHPAEAVLIARAVLKHVVNASPTKGSIEYLKAGTDLGEQLRRAGQSLEGCALLRNLLKKFPVPPASEESTFTAAKRGTRTEPVPHRSSVARALFTYASLLHATSRQAEAMEYSQQAIRVWESCPASPEIRQKLLMATSREMILRNDIDAGRNTGDKCRCVLM